MRSLILALLILAACTATATAAVHSQLPPIGRYPDTECTNEIGANGAGPGDIYVGPDAHFWECICEERVFTDNDCAWYDQGPVRSAKLRKRIKARYHLRVIPRSSVWALA